MTKAHAFHSTINERIKDGVLKPIIIECPRKGELATAHATPAAPASAGLTPKFTAT